MPSLLRLFITYFCLTIKPFIKHLTVLSNNVLKLFSPHYNPNEKLFGSEIKCCIVFTRVFIFDCCSFHYAHVWSKPGISICWRHSVTSKKSSNSNKFSKNTYFTSNVRNMFWATILYKQHAADARRGAAPDDRRPHGTYKYHGRPR